MGQKYVKRSATSQMKLVVSHFELYKPISTPPIFKQLST